MGVWGYRGGSRKCFLAPVERRDKANLIPIIQRWIAPGSIIGSDCWKPYDELSKLGYVHKKVNHSVEFVNEDELLWPLSCRCIVLKMHFDYTIPF